MYRFIKNLTSSILYPGLIDIPEQLSVRLQIYWITEKNIVVSHPSKWIIDKTVLLNEWYSYSITEMLQRCIAYTYRSITYR